MAALKLNFRFQRQSHDPQFVFINDEQAKRKLENLFAEFEIQPIRIYDPSRNTIKVLFPTDEEINKVLRRRKDFAKCHFETRLTMALKSTRTVFCSGFDESILRIYGVQEIKRELQGKGWGVVDVYIMQRTKTFKIEFNTRKEAEKFIINQNTSLGAIMLRQKEKEVDPTVPQCWGCGVLYPNHKSQECQAQMICLKCGERDHIFKDCDIPRTIEEMTEEQKNRRYCIPCKRRGHHTSLCLSVSY